MARYHGPKLKKMRRFGLATEGASKRIAKARRKTLYGERLEEKQKLKFIYDVMEKQFARYMHSALISTQEPEQALIERLEARLETVVYRLGFAKTMNQARQLITHGFVRVDGKKVDIPSFSVLQGSEISLSERIANNQFIQENITRTKTIPAWLERIHTTGKLLRYPDKQEVNVPSDVKKVIELYT